MGSRLHLHSQLCSIMETMARSALSQISSLLDEDSAELQLEVSRLLFANSALVEKVHRLESELCTVRSDSPNSCRSYRTVGVQTVRHSDGEPQESGCPTIEAIFGKDWCMSLWKDRGPYHPDTDSPQTCDMSVATISGQITKSGDSVEGAVSSCQQETLSTAEHGESTAVEPEPLSLAYAADGSTCTLSIDRKGEPVESAAAIEKPSMQLISNNDTEEAFSTYIIPIEDDDDDDDDEVQFVQDSQPEPLPMNAAASGPSNNKLQISSTDNTETSTAVEKDSKQNLTVINAATVGDPDKQTCSICSRTFYHKGTLTRHMKSHKSNFCSICKQHFHHKTKFKSHTCVPPHPSKTVSKTCPLCGKNFRNPSALKMHYVVHTGEKPFTCSFCGKGFTQKGNLKSHQRIHSREKGFCCDKCGETFTQQASLSEHMMTHRNPEVVGDTSVA